MYFIPVACFLLFNLMDWAGRSLTAVCMWVSNSAALNNCLSPSALQLPLRVKLSQTDHMTFKMHKSDFWINARPPDVFLEFFLTKLKGFSGVIQRKSLDAVTRA